jgi:hypothetical protein
MGPHARSATIPKQQSSVSLVFSALYFLFTLQWLAHFRIIVRETRCLVSALLHGTTTWIIMLGRLLVFIVILMPGWYNLMRYWLFDSKILRNIEYGKGSLARNDLDVYLPNAPRNWYTSNANENSKSESESSEDSTKGAPVVIFVGGGVWIIGNKLWSALIARSIAAMGYLVIVPDYRNFPQGTIEDMCNDVTSALKWTTEHCKHYGGNKNHIIMAGQSAGAHIVLCSVLDMFEGKRRRRKRSGTEDTVILPMPVHEGGNEYADLSQCLDETLLSEHGGGHVQTGVIEPGSPGGFFNRMYSGIDWRGAKARAEEQQQQEEEEGDYGDSHDDDDDTVSFGSGGNGTLSVSTVDNEEWEHAVQGEEHPYDTIPVSTTPQKHRNANGDISPRLLSRTSGKGHGKINDNVSNDDDEEEEDDGKQFETPAAMEERRQLLSCVKLLVLLNGPFDLVSLESHLHHRGLDSSILRWIFIDDLAHYSPTLRLRQMVSRASMIKNGGEHWHSFPAVGIVSCGKDRSVPLAQATGLERVLSSVRYTQSGGLGSESISGEQEQQKQAETGLGVCLINYTGASHTDLVVEGPLEGDHTLPSDFNAMVRAVQSQGARGLTGFTSCSPTATNSKMTNMKTAKAVSFVGKKKGEKSERGLEKSNRQEAIVHPFLVAVARRTNPF